MHPIIKDILAAIVVLILTTWLLIKYRKFIKEEGLKNGHNQSTADYDRYLRSGEEP